MPYLKTLAAAPAMLAALSLTVAPASAAELPVTVHAPAHADAVPVFDIEAAQTAEHRRYYRYRRGPGLGDVLAGVLIVGAVAHAAKAATRDDRRYRDRDYRRDVRWDDDRGIDRAVEMCISAVERRSRVETVDRADRIARGWRIEGTLSRGGGFACDIDNDGRGVEVRLGRGADRYEREDRDYRERDYRDREDRDERDDRDDRDDEDRYDDIGYEDNRSDREGPARDESRDDDDQWDDDRYASEWSKVDRSAPVETAQAPETAYPGGPVDEEDAAVDADLEIGTGYKGAGA